MPVDTSSTYPPFSLTPTLCVPKANVQLADTLLYSRWMLPQKSEMLTTPGAVSSYAEHYVSSSPLVQPGQKSVVHAMFSSYIMRSFRLLSQLESGHFCRIDIPGL